MNKKTFLLFLSAIILLIIAAYCIFFVHKGQLFTKNENTTNNQKTVEVSSTVDDTNTSEKHAIEPENSETFEDEIKVENEEILVTEPEIAPELEPEPLPPPPPVYVPVNAISLTFFETQLVVGQTTMPIVTMSPWNATNKGEIWTSSDENIATVDELGNIKAISKGTCTVTVTSSDNKDVFATVNVTVIPDVEPTYIDGILIVNKTYPLPRSYAPGYDTEAVNMLYAMFEDAKKEGHSLWIGSGYRSYIDQHIIYNNYVARDGKAAADTYSARPGHSEHQTGLAFDLNNIAHNFAYLPEGIWVAENCHKYGFIVRYPKDKQHITGYIYEPWHIRYIGVEKATAVYESGLCLEEFLGITSVYSY